MTVQFDSGVVYLSNDNMQRVDTLTRKQVEEFDSTIMCCGVLLPHQLKTQLKQKMLTLSEGEVKYGTLVWKWQWRIEGDFVAFEGGKHGKGSSL